MNKDQFGNEVAELFGFEDGMIGRGELFDRIVNVIKAVKERAVEGTDKSTIEIFETLPRLIDSVGDIRHENSKYAAILDALFMIIADVRGHDVSKLKEEVGVNENEESGEEV